MQNPSIGYSVTYWFLLKVDCMEEALERSQEDHAPDLKVSFLLDYTRGSRGLF